MQHELPRIIYIGPSFQASQNQSAKRACLDRFEHTLPCKIDTCAAVPDLMCQLANPTYQVDFIAMDLEYLYSIDQGVDGSSMLDVVRSLAVFLKLSNIASRIIGVVGHDTDAHLIRLAQEVPEIWTLTMRMGGPWSFADVIQDARRYFSGDSTVPQAIRDRVYVSAKRTQHPTATIVLTPRQNQILDLVSNRGASNKAIARTLNIAESTVKLHMSAILKKYGCRNRTQLAVFSRCQDRNNTSV